MSASLAKRSLIAGMGNTGPEDLLGIRAQVAEWLMAADCKSAAPSGLRRFESSPVHQDLK